MSAVHINIQGHVEPVQVSYYALPHFFHRKVEIAKMGSEVLWQQIIESITEVLGITQKALTSPCRKQKIVRGRMYACLLARRHTTYTLTEIGQRLGRRDHTTVIHGLQTIQHRIKHEEGCAREWRLICNRLGVVV